MLIDWFTVAAQIVNFLVLVALLRHFLYGPIVRAMDRREEQVVSLQREAEDRLREAEEEKRRYLDRQQNLDREREALLSRAREQAAELHQHLLTGARREMEESKQRWRAGLAREQENFLGELRQRAGLRVLAVAAKALAELADARLEQELVRRLIYKLGGLEEGDRFRLREAARNGPIMVASVFALSREEQQRLGGKIREIAGSGAELRFEVDPELICGLKIRVPGGVMGWNLKKYLDELEQDLGQAVEEEVNRGQAAGQEIQSRGSVANPA